MNQQLNSMTSPGSNSLGIELFFTSQSRGHQQSKEIIIPFDSFLGIDGLDLIGIFCTTYREIIPRNVGNLRGTK